MALLPCGPSGPRAALCAVVLRVAICSPRGLPPAPTRDRAAVRRGLPWVPEVVPLLCCTSAMSFSGLVR